MKQVISFSKVLSKVLIFALLAWVAFQPEPVFAEIYKYTDEHGKIYFTDDASKIPVRYRNKDSVEKFKEVNEPTPGSGTSSGPPGQASEGEGDVKKDTGLNLQDEGLVKKAIRVFQVGIALGNQYKDSQPNSSNGRRAVNAIQNFLPVKESLANELAGTKVPELQAALEFLKQSIAVNRQTTSIGAGLKTRIVGIFKRLTDEAKQQAALIQKLEQGLKDSEKKKAEAAKKKEVAVVHDLEFPFFK